MKKAMLGILMIVLTPCVSLADDVPKAYLAKSVLAKCGDTITPQVADLIEENYFIIYNAWQASKIRFNFRLGTIGVKEYCRVLKQGEKKLFKLR